ncbi:nucleotidyltransferase domain-containing protein [archaeon]|nr:MAG: nucleotidyltransferase domain-containing protein [archaeon]
MKIFDDIINKAGKDENILAVIVFGSFARKEKYSDIDICLVLKRKMEPLKMSKIKLGYMKDFPSFDIQIFQQLPLYIRIRILKEGKILFCSNMDMLYDMAFSTIKEFGDYKHIYNSYLEGVMHA